MCHWPLTPRRCEKGCTTCAKCSWHAANRSNGNIVIKTYACCTQQGQQQSNSHNNHEQIACCILHASATAWRDISPWRGIETYQQHNGNSSGSGSGSGSRMLGAIWRFRLLRKYAEQSCHCAVVFAVHSLLLKIFQYLSFCVNTRTHAHA